MSYLAQGDVAFSVGTASTLLSPVVTPMLILWLSGEIIDINAFAMFKSILIVTLFPVAYGHKSPVAILETIALAIVAVLQRDFSVPRKKIAYTKNYVHPLKIASRVGYANAYSFAKALKNTLKIHQRKSKNKQACVA